MPEQQLLSWSTYEFEEKDRHRDWHWYVGLVFGLAAVIAFFYGNIFFGILLVVAGAVTIIYAFRKPKMLTVAFQEKGIQINEELIPFEKIKEFWLDETDKPDKLLLRVPGAFIPIISIPLSEVSADAVRAMFKEKVPETEIQQSNSEKLFDRIGF